MFLSLFLLALTAQDDASLTWPDYRGADRDGHSASSSNLPLRWGEDQHVTWKTELPGRGWSTPAVEGGRVWCTTADPKGHHLSVLCVDLGTGEVLLERELFEVKKPQERNALNSYASPSPVIDAGRVYVWFGNDGLVCLDTSSFEELWRRTDINCEHLMGAGSSPFLHGDHLYLNVDGADVQFVTALRKGTGETTWKVQRDTKLMASVVPDLRKAYSTPIVAVVDGEEQLISTGAQMTLAYELDTGKEIWRVKHGGFSMSSRPVLARDLVLLNTGFNTPQLWAVRLGGKGDITESHRVWRLAKGMPTMPSPVVVEDLLYTVSDGGVASAVDLDNGEQVWRKRLGNDFSASPVYAAGRVYFCDREGKTTVIAPGREYKELAVNELESGCMASPVVLGDTLLLRTKTHLYRIEAPKAQGAAGGN